MNPGNAFDCEAWKYIEPTSRANFKKKHSLYFYGVALETRGRKRKGGPQEDDLPLIWEEDWRVLQAIDFKLPEWDPYLPAYLGAYGKKSSPLAEQLGNRKPLGIADYETLSGAPYVARPGSALYRTGKTVAGELFKAVQCEIRSGC